MVIVAQIVAVFLLLLLVISLFYRDKKRHPRWQLVRTILPDPVNVIVPHPANVVIIEQRNRYLTLDPVNDRVTGRSDKFSSVLPAMQQVRYRLPGADGYPAVELLEAEMRIFSPDSTSIAETIPLPGAPSGCLRLAGGHVLVSIGSRNLLMQVAMEGLQDPQTWKVTGVPTPGVISIDYKNGLIFCASAQHLVVLDRDSGANINLVDTGDRVTQLIFDPGYHLLFCLLDSNQLLIIHQSGREHYTPVQLINFISTIGDIQFSAATGKLFAASADDEEQAIEVYRTG